MPDQEEKSEPKILLAEAILVGLLIFFIGLLGEIPIIGPLFDFAFTQIYLRMKGMKGSYQIAMLASNGAMLAISAVGFGFLEAFSDTITFFILVWMDHHPKVAKVAITAAAVSAAAGATVLTGGAAAPAIPAAAGVGGAAAGGAAAAGAGATAGGVAGAGGVAAGGGVAGATTAGVTTESLAAAETGGSLSSLSEEGIRAGAKGAETGMEGFEGGGGEAPAKPGRTKRLKEVYDKASDARERYDNLKSQDDERDRANEETPFGSVALGNGGESVDLREAA
jgi:hypothetical protein